MTSIYYYFIVTQFLTSSLGLFVDIKGATDRFLANHRCKKFDWWPIRRADKINMHDPKMPEFTARRQKICLGHAGFINDKQSVQMMKNKYIHKEIHKIMKQTLS